MAVVLEHATNTFGISNAISNYFANGEIAVESFYIISGFYISYILSEKYIGANNSYKLFLTNRLLRLFPIYWFVLFLAISSSLFYYFYSNYSQLGYFTIYAEHFNTLNISSLVYLILTNIFIVGQDTLLFLGLNSDSGYFYFTENFQKTSPQLYQFVAIPQAWTISIEIMFYCVAPFILKKDFKLILLLFFSSIGIKLFLAVNGFNFDPWTYRFFPTEFAYFLAGNISYRLYSIINKKEISPNYLYIALCLTLLSILLNSLLFPSNFKILYFILFAIAIAFIFKLTKNNSIDSIIGNLSYPMYLSHVFLIVFISKIQFPTYFDKTVVLIISTVLFSLLLNRFISNPIEKLRQQRLLK